MIALSFRHLLVYGMIAKGCTKSSIFFGQFVVCLEDLLIVSFFILSILRRFSLSCKCVLSWFHCTLIRVALISEVIMLALRNIEWPNE